LLRLRAKIQAILVGVAGIVNISISFLQRMRFDVSGTKSRLLGFAEFESKTYERF
jgi:hypothetical protein